MKISQLAEKYGIPKDTVQYYTKLGLLVPRQKGAGHDFTQREEEDLQYIQKLKTMQFSLKEIQQIMHLRRISNWNEPETVCDYLRMLDNRDQQISEDIRALEEARRLVAAERSTMEAPATQRTRLGVPLVALQYLVCPNCGRPLRLNEGEIMYPYVFGGHLDCGCGWSARIRDGVLDTGNRYTGLHDSPDLSRALYRGMPADFYRFMNLCADKLVTRMNGMDLSGKLVLETHVNGYSFLYNHLKELKNDCIYVICDKYVEIIRMYKDLLELLGVQLNILFIADASASLPLAKESVSLLISFFASGEHSLYFENMLVDDMERYLRPRAQVLGTQMIFPARTLGNLKKKYPEGGLKGFTRKNHEDAFERNSFRLEWEDVGSLLKTPDQFSFSCHVDGDPLVMSYFRAVR